MRKCQFTHEYKVNTIRGIEWESQKYEGFFHGFYVIGEDVCAICETKEGNVKIIWEVETIKFINEDEIDEKQ